MGESKEYPENIRQAADLIVAVLRRIKEKRLDNHSQACLYMTEQKGLASV